MKVFMVLPNLLLQKPSPTSKAKEHTKVLEQRMKLWEEGKTVDILKECRTIQKKLTTGKKRSAFDVTRVFSKLVLEGKIGAALKFLDENAEKIKIDIRNTPARHYKLSLLQGQV